MSKTSSTELFDLIQSLSKGEKRYFKVHSSRHTIGEENKYVKLFDAICKQKLYDEKHLLENEKYVRQLPLLKKRLYHSILKSLEVYHTSIDAEIRKLLHQAEILYEKALYEQAKKILRSVKGICKEHDLLTYELEISRWEIKIAWALDNLEEIGDILSEEKNILHSLDNLKKYQMLNQKIFSLYYKHGIPRTPETIRQIKKLVSNPLLKNPKQANSFEALHTFYHFQNIYHTMHQDYRKANSFGIKKLELFSEHPEKIKSYTNLYLGDLNDALISAMMLEDYKQMEIYVQKLRELEKIITSERGKAVLFFYSYHELNYYTTTGQFQKAVKRIETLEEQFPLYENKITPAKRAVLYMLFAISFFGNENYKKSIFYLNKIRNENMGGVRSDIESFAHLLSLLAHFEKGNDKEFLQSLVRSVYHYLLKRNRLYKFEEAIINFIRGKLSKVHSNKELLQAFTSLKTELEKILKDPFERGGIQDFDFISWLESKIENKSFGEIIRRKIKSHVSF